MFDYLPCDINKSQSQADSILYLGKRGIYEDCSAIGDRFKKRMHLSLSDFTPLCPIVANPLILAPHPI